MLTNFVNDKTGLNFFIIIIIVIIIISALSRPMDPIDVGNIYSVKPDGTTTLKHYGLLE